MARKVARPDADLMRNARVLQGTVVDPHFGSAGTEKPPKALEELNYEDLMAVTKGLLESLPEDRREKIEERLRYVFENYSCASRWNGARELLAWIKNTIAAGPSRKCIDLLLLWQKEQAVKWTATLPWQAKNRDHLDLIIQKQLPAQIRLLKQPCLCGRVPQDELPDLDQKRWSPSIRAPHHERDLYEWILSWLHGVRPTEMRKRLSEAATRLGEEWEKQIRAVDKVLRSAAF
jgi:hypothetical protein